MEIPNPIDPEKAFANVPPAPQAPRVHALVPGTANAQDRSLSPDFQEAERFLGLLDPTATSFTFQTFDDDADRKRHELARVFQGTLQEHWDTLVELNRQGAGIFVTVNETDGNGRKKSNIVRIRAIWQEDDEGNAPPLPHKPHIVVESSRGKYHRYVLTEGLGAELDQFEPVQRRLVDDYGSDPNAKDRSRVLRLPGFFHQKVDSRKGLIGTPFMTRLLSASGDRPLPWGRVLELFPPVQEKSHARATRAPSMTSAPASADSRPLPDGVEALNRLLTGATREELWQALCAIPADDYHEWVRIGMLLKTVAYQEDGFLLWDTWSKRSHNYPGLQETRRKWDHDFPAEPGGHWKAIFKIAVEQYGWVNLRAAARAETISYWDVVNCDPERDEALVNAYREQERRAFNEKHGLLMIEGKSIVIYRELNENTDSIETKYAQRDSVSAHYSNRKLPKVIRPAEGAPYISWDIGVYPDWLQSYSRRTYSQPVFRPAPGLLASTTMPESGGSYNLYVGASFAPVKGSCQRILNHIYNVWCQGHDESYRYVICWLARMVQQPGTQGVTVIVLRSGQGGGKNIILDMFDDYFGAHSVMLTKPEDLAGFNDHLATSVFVFLNEALWGGNKAVEGAVKSTITDSKLLVERKYIPKFKARNCTHIMVATNNDWAVPVGLDDRRFFILDLAETHKDDPSYFEPLVREITNGGREAFLYYLENEVDLSGFNVRVIPETNSATKLDHKIRTADTITRWLIDALTEGGFGHESNSANFSIGGTRTRAFTDWPDDEPLIIDSDLFYQSYRESVRGPHVEAKNTVSKKVGELLGGPLKRNRPNQDGSRPRRYVLPSLIEARGVMEKTLKQEGPWHEEEVEL